MDTLKIAQRLSSAGFSGAQSDAVIDALREVVDGEIATKTDLARLEAKLTQDMARLEAKLTQDMARLEASFQGLRTEFARIEGRVDKLQWMLGVVIALSVAILVKLLLT